MKRTILLAAVACLFAAVAQPAIKWVPEKQLWLLETDHTTYAFGYNERKQLQHVYWGGRVSRTDDFAAVKAPRDYAFETSEGMTPDEYSGWGGMRYDEPALKATFADGMRDLALRYVSHQITGDTLSVRLKDIDRDLFVTLLYTVHEKSDLVERHSKIENRTKGKVLLESAQSATWPLPNRGQYRLSYLAGRWAGETQLIREPVTPGVRVLDSRRGNTSHQLNPWFALDAGADENSGAVWFGALAWSGNWKIAVELTSNGFTRVTGGFNDFDFGYNLAPGDSLETPAFYGGYSSHGFGEASRIMHRFERTQLLPDRADPKPRPVLYNSWEATEFAVDEPGQTVLADKAAKLGAEMFVMDDGWFGARNDDHAGLGDWTVNPKKFPNGLKALIDHVNGLGMRFGLWVEPEMINADSNLYRAHSDWVVSFDGRRRTEGRNQMILNIARNDVRDYVYGVLDKMLKDNPNISFLKWDMNRHFSEPGWANVPVEDQKKIWVAYVRNVYWIFDRLRAEHSKVEIESCSGGGGRIDLGILNNRVHQVWTSDNTEAFDRLKIQEGFSMAYAPKVMMAWVTDVPNMNGRVTPLRYRFQVSMMGSVGVGGNLNHWSADDMKLGAEMVALYKDIRLTVQHGNLYRLLSPREGEVTSNFYVGADGKQSVLFAFLDHQQFNRGAAVIPVRGLQADGLYKVRTIDNKFLNKQDTLSGAYLMNNGVQLDLKGDYDSTVVVFEKVN
ncbi:MAG: alpha-galactosidase [Bryobacteraceae bacterium]